MYFIIKLIVRLFKHLWVNHHQEEDAILEERPTEGVDCSCVPLVFTRDHPPDLPRLIRILEDARDQLDRLDHIMSPISRMRRIWIHIDLRMFGILSGTSDSVFLGKKYAAAGIQHLQKLLRNEPVDQEYDMLELFPD